MLTYRGSVNRWECDENDHMNVRYCVEKLYETFFAGLIMTNNYGALENKDSYRGIKRVHIRFQNEARLSAPLSGHFHGLSSSSSAGDFNCLAYLQDGSSGKLFCSMLLQLTDPLDCSEETILSIEEMPEVRPRGLIDTFPISNLAMSEAEGAGFVVSGRGLVRSDDCDDAGNMKVPAYMGKASDSVPNLWTHLMGDEQVSDSEGGAVAEFKKTFHGVFKEGDVFTVMSGLLEARGKIQRFAHLFFRQGDGRLIMSAEAISVRFNLLTRKASEIQPEMLKRLESKKLNLKF